MASAAHKALFVAFEGIDGSGKTTISNRVAAKLRERGLKVTHVREQGRFASAVTQSIRELGRDQRNLAMTPRAELLLMVARDLQLWEEATAPALETSDVVLADRFLYTAQVLAEHGRGLPASEVKSVIAASSPGVEPDLVVLIDVEPSLAWARRRVAKLLQGEGVRRSSRKGLGGRGLQQRMREGYLALAQRDPWRWMVLDNSDAPLALVESQIVEGLILARRGLMERARQLMREGVGRTAGRAVGADLREARRHFLDWIDRRAENEPDVAAFMLAGMCGTGVDERRVALAERAPAMVAYGLRALDDAVSWKLRHRLTEVAPGQVAASLLGAPGTGTEGARLQRSLSPLVPASVAASLVSRDDAHAWALREELFGRAPHAVVASLEGTSSARAWTMRDRLVADHGGLSTLGYEEIASLCKSIEGLDDERSWEMREHAYETSPVCVLKSLTGATSSRAHEWRWRHVERAPEPVMSSLFGLDDETAWRLRDRVAAGCMEAVGSVYGIGTERGWALREGCRDLWPSAVGDSLGPELAQTPRGARLVDYLLSAHGGIALLRVAAALESATGPRGADR
jgi:dTMP kinase